jgi:hypothetical protein
MELSLDLSSWFVPFEAWEAITAGLNCADRRYLSSDGDDANEEGALDSSRGGDGASGDTWVSPRTLLALDFFRRPVKSYSVDETLQVSASGYGSLPLLHWYQYRS